MFSSLTVSASIAINDASKNVAENVPRLILFAMLASVSFNPCFAKRSASSRYPTACTSPTTIYAGFTKACGPRQPYSLGSQTGYGRLAI